jgi:hypothetical protein
MGDRVSIRNLMAFCLFPLALCFTSLDRIQAQDALRVEAKATANAAFVGQAIEIRVGILAEKVRPMIVPPHVEGAEITAIDTAFQQISASRIGESVIETNMYIARYRLIASNPGPLLVPGFQARLGESVGASNSIRLTIKPVPLDGRPASYLRGIGRMTARASVEPTSLRVGKNAEYRLILEGPGARASTQRPSLKEFEAIKGLEVDSVSSTLVADPPVRTFVYKITPVAPSNLVLPSVAVATFDPTLQRYVESRAPSVTLKVVDVPKFDEATIEHALPITIPINSHAISSIIYVLLTSIAILLIVWSVYLRLLATPSRQATKAAKILRKGRRVDLAEFVSKTLRDYLTVAKVRPTGELTPYDARIAVEKLCNDSSMGEAAGRLIEACDRARFGGVEPGENEALAEQAIAFLDQLAKSKVS